MGFTSEEKLQIVFQGMKDNITIKELCEKHGISRKTYYDWRDDIKESAKANWDNSKVGRKAKDEVSSIPEAQQKINELKKTERIFRKRFRRSRKRGSFKQTGKRLSQI